LYSLLLFGLAGRKGTSLCFDDPATAVDEDEQAGDISIETFLIGKLPILISGLTVLRSIRSDSEMDGNACCR